MEVCVLHWVLNMTGTVGWALSIIPGLLALIYTLCSVPIPAFGVGACMVPFAE